MKDLKYIIIAVACIFLASCMGEDYAGVEFPDGTAAPYGNNALKETNVLSIAQLKEKFASVISSSSYTEVAEDIQIKGIVTGNDVAGNIYNEIALQDSTGATLVCIAAGGLSGSLPVGQEVLISLKGLILGGYGQQLEIGGIYTNSKTGALGVGRLSRAIWEQHYKLIGTADPQKAEDLAEDFDLSKAGDADYLAKNAGKLMTIRKVSFKDADGKAVYAPSDGSVALTANCANRQLMDQSGSTPKAISTNTLVVRTSSYAKFANEPMRQDTIDITGIFTRYRNVWQVLLRSTNDMTRSQMALLDEPFAESQGAFTIQDISLGEGLNYVWKWTNANYGMKASAYVNGSNVPAQSRLISPALNLSAVKSATLSFDHAGKFFADVEKDCRIQISTDGQNWTDVKASAYPDGSSWNFVHATIDLTPYCGKNTVYIGFLYTSTETAAPTWEIKNVLVE